jgi:uncharacterized damage-inducible protein DinB
MSALAQRFRTELLAILEETFEKVSGMYLDRSTSLFETLETISAEEASRPVSERSKSIAAQVNHTRFYLDVLMGYFRHEEMGKVDWSEAWQQPPVSESEWQTLKNDLRHSYQVVHKTVSECDDWDDEERMGTALAMLVHSAYHLGEIRQALGIVQQRPKLA